MKKIEKKRGKLKMCWRKAIFADSFNKYDDKGISSSGGLYRTAKLAHNIGSSEGLPH